jgi:hypothetical protein
MDDGVIKYQCHWLEKEANLHFDYSAIEVARTQMFKRNWIGHDKNYDVGFGNISQRLEDHQFIISGTQTGHLEQLSPNEYTIVTQYNIDKNTLTCEGPVKASSESLTHAAIYEQNTSIKCIVHIHQADFWNRLLTENKGITNPSITYGTPEMADEINRLFKEEDILSRPLIAMAGHLGGIISFGKNFEEATQILERTCKNGMNT